MDLDEKQMRQAGGFDMELEKFLLDFTNEHMIEITAPSKKPGAIVNTPADQGADSNIPAGYTYFGQFVDHDITFDPVSSLMRQNDPSGLLNHRTPRLDLDNLYGRGPAGDPHLYQKETEVKKDNIDLNGKKKSKFKFEINKAKSSKDGTEFDVWDLPRVNGAKAVIGDPRNDENVIVSQLHLAFLMAHNTLFDKAIEQLEKKIQKKKNREKLTDVEKEEAFNTARKTLSWLYQYIVWNDFLGRITDKDVHEMALELKKFDENGRKVIEPKYWKLGLKEVYNWKYQPFIPIEFSGAAYRFGHTMVRNSYRTNAKRGATKTDFVVIFDNSNHVDDESKRDDLRGGREISIKNAIQWNWFLDIAPTGGDFPQMARKLDTKLANALAFLHEEKLEGGEDVKQPVNRKFNFLAFRNLLRGHQFDLPSGTAVAKKYCIKPLTLDLERKNEDTPPNDIDALWYYILKEAGSSSRVGGGGGNKLGKVGSTIICATFAGLLKGDPNSYFNIDPCWNPAEDGLLKDAFDQMKLNEVVKSKEIQTLAAIIRLSGLPVDKDDIEKLAKKKATSAGAS